jgi:hypothetical protein
MNRVIPVLACLALLIAACGSSPPADPDAAAPEPTAPATPSAVPEPTATAVPEPTAVTPTPQSEPTVATPTARALDQPGDEVGLSPDTDYPPGDAAGIAALIDPLVADLGLRFTYGSLIDRTARPTFEASATGDHFAVYVEPVADYTDAEYIENTWVLAERLTPFLFATYPGLASYDVCQEPRPAENDEAVPPPVTQLDIFRGPASEIDWENGSLATLIASNRDEPSTTLRIEARLQQLPEFVDELRLVE